MTSCTANHMSNNALLPQGAVATIQTLGNQLEEDGVDDDYDDSSSGI